MWDAWRVFGVDQKRFFVHVSHAKSHDLSTKNRLFLQGIAKYPCKMPQPLYACIAQPEHRFSQLRRSKIDPYASFLICNSAAALSLCLECLAASAPLIGVQNEIRTLPKQKYPKGIPGYTLGRDGRVAGSGPHGSFARQFCQVPGPFAGSDPSPTATARTPPRKEFVPGRQSL
jgi:hypothetical protein